MATAEKARISGVRPAQDRGSPAFAFREGTGVYQVNGLEADAYFTVETSGWTSAPPLIVTEMVGPHRTCSSMSTAAARAVSPALFASACLAPLKEHRTDLEAVASRTRVLDPRLS